MLSVAVNRRMPLDKFFAHLDREYKEWLIKHEKGTYVLECKRRPNLSPTSLRRRVIAARTPCDFVRQIAEVHKSSS